MHACDWKRHLQALVEAERSSDGCGDIRLPDAAIELGFYEGQRLPSPSLGLRTQPAG